MKEKINDYEMSIRKTTKKSEKCSICGYRRPEMYLIHRHGGSYYMCRECVSYFLAISCSVETCAQQGGSRSRERRDETRHYLGR